MLGKLRPDLRARIILAFAVLLGASSIALTASASEHHTATRTDVSFSYSVGEEVEPGEGWVDEAGVAHLRNRVEAGEISGDIEGSARVTINADIEDVSALYCPPDAGAGCSVIFSFIWGQVEIDAEGGRWRGRFLFNDVAAEGIDAESLPPVAFTGIFLQGTGDYAHESIAANIASVNEDLSQIDFAGIRSTLATPIEGLNTSVQVCVDEDGTFAGGFLSSGLVETSGSVTAFEPIDSGGRWTHDNRALWGRTTLADDQGSFTIDFLATARDVGTTMGLSRSAWGQFIVIDGSEAYAGLHGQGRFVGTARQRADCGSGFGYELHFIGEAHLNPAPAPEPEEPQTDEEMAGELWDELQAQGYQDTWPIMVKGELYRGQPPHGALLTTYLSPEADEAAAALSGTMPEDAIIVKENYMPDGQLDALTVMYKEPGYDPEHGDWFWAKFGAGGEIQAAGVVEDCVACHGAVRSNDYIFSFPLAPIEVEAVEPTDEDMEMAAELWQMLQDADYQNQWATVPGKGELYEGQVPHGALLTTYLSPEAEEAAISQSGAMAADATIVKENYMPDGQLDALTVMYKEPGYDPEHGDWFWAKYGAEGEIQAAGVVADCVACHGAVQTNDFVFTFPVAPLDLSSSGAAVPDEGDAALVRQAAVLSLPVLALVTVLGLRHMERRTEFRRH